jgi:GPI mannosyltransferase 3
MNHVNHPVYKETALNRRFLVRWLLIALLLHLLAAIFSTGYQNSDEHFQILEFLNSFLGRTPPASLPVEFTRMIRPWFQPFLYWIPVRALLSLGVTNPFTWALWVRGLSALIGWFSLVALASCVPLWIREARWQKVAIITLALTWYLPALHARHSSENLSGALFVLGLCWLVRSGRLGTNETRQPGWGALLGGGILWGLAFEARYQVGFMVAGGFFWLALIARLRIRDLTGVAGGILAAIVFGTCLDRIGYEQWTFAPWNYFHFNLVEGYASIADTSPWWDYFRRIWTETWPLLGFTCFGGMMVFWVLRPKHPLTWSYLPLLAVHTAIAHKEMRFLFPLAHAAPLCLVMVLEMKWEWIKRHRTLRYLAWAVVGMNAIALLAFTFIPASPTVRFYRKVYDLALEGKLSELRYREWDPYSIGGISMYFYLPPGLKTLPLESSPPSGPFYYAWPHPSSIPALAARCDVEVHSIMDLGFPESFHNWTLFHCRSS